jgi:hypothetical protein
VPASHDMCSHLAQCSVDISAIPGCLLLVSVAVTGHPPLGLAVLYGVGVSVATSLQKGHAVQSCGLGRQLRRFL